MKRWKIPDDYREGELEILIDDQGDIYLTTNGTVRFTGPGGGSAYRGLAKALIQALTPTAPDEKSKKDN